MKTKLTNIALIAFLLVNSFNVMAGSLNHMKMKDSSATVNTGSSEAFIEMDMEMENWMTSFKSFLPADANFESEMVLESWMLKDFNSAEGSLEQDLQFESWMFQPFMTESDLVFHEKELTFEPWMLKF
jgi:hypothetical protein